MKVEKILKELIQVLNEKGFETPWVEAELILCHVLKTDKTSLYTRYNRTVSDKELKNINDILKRRLNHEPIQYLTKKVNFFGFDFIIKPPLLIPRPETEILIEILLKLIPSKDKKLLILDVGTGSGIIGITILKFLKSATVYAIDIDDLKTAKENAELHKVDDRIQFIKSDLLNAIKIKADIIVSNPPYIPTSDIPKLQKEIKLFESKKALNGGKNGSLVTSRLIKNAASKLKKTGILIIEISPEQKDKLSKEAVLYFKKTESFNDLSGNPRILVCQNLKT